MATANGERTADYGTHSDGSKTGGSVWRQVAKAIVAIAVVVLGHLAAAQMAHAEEGGEYHEAMREFAPVIDEWAEAIRKAARASAANRRSVRQAELSQLARQGQTILEDVRGTQPPAELHAAHWYLADAIGTLVAGAEVAGEDAGLEAETRAVGRALMRVQVLLAGTSEAPGEGGAQLLEGR